MMLQMLTDSALNFIGHKITDAMIVLPSTSACKTCRARVTGRQHKRYDECTWCEFDHLVTLSSDAILIPGNAADSQTR